MNNKKKTKKIRFFKIENYRLRYFKLLIEFNIFFYNKKKQLIRHQQRLFFFSAFWKSMRCLAVEWARYRLNRFIRKIFFYILREHLEINIYIEKFIMCNKIKMFSIRKEVRRKYMGYPKHLQPDLGLRSNTTDFKILPTDFFWLTSIEH